MKDMILLVNKETDLPITLSELFQLYRKEKLEDKKDKRFAYVFNKGDTICKHFIPYQEIKMQSELSDDITRKQFNILWNK